MRPFEHKPIGEDKFRLGKRDTGSDRCRTEKSVLECGTASGLVLRSESAQKWWVDSRR